MNISRFTRRPLKGLARRGFARKFDWNVVLFVGSAITLLVSARANENWPQWRGPEGNGTSDSVNLPSTWSTNKNIVWKVELPSWSGATPIVWGDRVFVTSPSKVVPGTSPAEGERQGGGRFGGGGSYGVSDPGGDTLLLICLSKKDGKILWQYELDKGNRLYRKQNATSPSPVTDGKSIWVVTGNASVTALDMEGKKIWSRNLRDDYGKFALNWGYASSPILVDGKLIIEVLQGFGAGGSYLVAFDGATGKEIWKKERKTDAIRESPDAYTTPALLVHDGKKQIVVNGGDYVTANDAITGDEVWRASGLNPRRNQNYRIIASVTVKDGMIFAPTRVKPLLALRAGGAGDVTESHLAWKYEAEGAPDVPSPVSDGKYLYMVSDNGSVTCLEAKTGKRLWGPERTTIGTVSASPLLADGKIYVTNEKAVTTIVAAGPEFKNLATNQLDDSYTLSSLAVAGRQIFLRTSNCLYCIGESVR
jgi:outer membrane protein assembly factor BamB